MSKLKVKERVGLYILLLLWAYIACSRVNFTFTLLPFYCNILIGAGQSLMHAGDTEDKDSSKGGRSSVSLELWRFSIVVSLILVLYYYYYYCYYHSHHYYWLLLQRYS